MWREKRAIQKSKPYTQQRQRGPGLLNNKSLAEPRILGEDVAVKGMREKTDAVLKGLTSCPLWPASAALSFPAPVLTLNEEELFNCISFFIKHYFNLI